MHESKGCPWRKFPHSLIISIGQGAGVQPAPPRRVGSIKASSRDFWRKRSHALEANLTEVRRHTDETEAGHRRIADNAAEIARLKRGDVPAGIGRLIASAGPFEVWIVALSERGKLRVEAASPGAPRPRSCSTRKARSSTASAARVRCRDSRACRAAHPTAKTDFSRAAGSPRIYAYRCLPLASGVIALASRASIDPAAARRAGGSGLAARLAPTIDAFTLRRELRTQRALVQSLVLRLYGAIDAERARIARDLHDDQAQLMIAARIAIEAPRKRPAGFCARSSTRCASRLRDLRPATLGRATLKAGLEGRAATSRRTPGLDARLLRGRRCARTLAPAPERMLAGRARGGLEHHPARARKARRAQPRAAGDLVRLKVADDGRGTRRRGRRQAESPGLGLSGLAERVALIGGTLRVDSQPNGTCVVAEIPALTPTPKARKPQR